MKNKTVFSIIIPTYNAKKYLKNCLASILKNDYPHYEIIVIDNASTDGSIGFIKKEFANLSEKIKIVSLNKNYGPSMARNEGVRIAKGKYLAFLDSDTEVHPDWMKAGLSFFEENKKVGAIQCKLLMLKNKKKIDYVGEHLSNLGFLVPLAKYGEKDEGQYNSSYKILAAKSAGMFIRKKVFEQVRGFDSDYFIFMEETDLGWRCWLSDYQVALCPTSIVYHHFSASKEIFDKETNNRLVRFHGTKNYILTLFKNLSFINLIKILPINICLWLGLSGYLLFKGNFLSSFNILKGICWNLTHFPQSLSKRWKIQRERKLTDENLFKDFRLMEKRPLFFFIKRFTISQKEMITPEG